MPIPFSSEDLGRVFDHGILARGRTLALAGAVTLDLAGDTITAGVRDEGSQYQAKLNPVSQNGRVAFPSECSCGRRSCAHVAAAALAVLDRHPAWRRIQQHSFLDSLIAAPPPPERMRLVYLLEPGEGAAAFFVTTVLEGDRTLKTVPIAPQDVMSSERYKDDERLLCRLLGGSESRNAVPAAEPQRAARLLDQLAESGQARWKPTNRKLVTGPQRSFFINRPPDLPPKSALLLAGPSRWYVDGQSGKIGAAVTKAPLAAPARRPPQSAPARSARPIRLGVTAPADLVIVDRPMVPRLRLMRLDCPDDFGRLQQMDALMLVFDYGGVAADIDDERQFVKLVAPRGEPVFVRRDRAGELRALDALRQDGFTQLRLQVAGNAKGQRVHVFRGRDATEKWQIFVAKRLPELEAEGWRGEIDAAFGPKMVEASGNYDVQIRDADHGWFSLELGIEIDGKRQPLLPILNRILEQGGMESAQITDGKLHTSLDDGRILVLPADRVARMLATMADLIENARRGADGSLMLPASEAPAVLDLEELLTTRWENAAAIRAYAGQFRDDAIIAPVPVPAGFVGALRHYQEEGLAWLQHLRAHGLAGILADDMGLGKTAQTIAHIVFEAEAGRLTSPALIVLPTSLVANWQNELARFSPALSVEVLHGLDRHEKRDRLNTAQVVLTTYTVLARDIEFMKEIEWHLVVLDEAQAIKSPDSKTTRAVCRLNARHKLCLSGTPIENNLDELWSQFAFLMPGLLGDRRGFTKRFRTPIEKKGDPTRRVQLVRRIKPFILRRTKSAVATELPPKHTIIRRITLDAEQRELYETIRVTMYDKVRHEIAEKSLSRSRIVLLDALLKLRQVCCDPRLVKLPSARGVESSAKLDDLMEMVIEMIAEGRRILLFSQFTSMLDLIKPVLDQAGVTYVELRGDTKDRGDVVDRFESGAVPLFLISLKAGGRGLNLTSADTVIHYDPWWNPAVEEQASDRAHRIGQTKSVFVYKLIAAGTVEERIVELQQRKTALANIALGGDMELSALEMDDIDYLFAPDAAAE